MYIYIYIYSLRHRKCGLRGYIHELFVSKPERASYERVRAFDTNNDFVNWNVTSSKMVRKNILEG